MQDYLKTLNPSQEEAVITTEGPTLVIAGAGAGKTRVLTYRIAYLLSRGVKPSSVLALTFTNKAAREMKERIAQLVGNDLSKYLWMGTFHSIFAKILRTEAVVMGYKSTFSIYDTDDSKSLIRSILKELNLDDKIYKPGEVLSRISSAKNNLITAQAYYNNAQIQERDRAAQRPRIADIYKIYAGRCKKAGAMDFDDLLLNTNILFRDFPEILRKYQNKFKYILVDEYQDTNYSQYLIVKKLGQEHNNICVVGDDAQSIYSFRGAKIENILNFRNDYPTYHLVKLEQNYRSTQTIVNAANSIIEKNRDQIRKRVFSKNEEGEKIKVVKALTDHEEGFLVSGSILETVLKEKQPYSDFAILYRTNAQSRIFEEALRKRNIPYKVYGSISFYQRKEIKDLLAYLRLTVNLQDDEALKRIINYPARGIGKTTLDKIAAIANEKEQSIWDVLMESTSYISLINRGTFSKLQSFVGMINGYRKNLAISNAYELANEVATSSGILRDLHNGNSPEEISKYENLEELLNGIREFVENNDEGLEMVTLENYLENISLLTDADNEKEEDKNKVTIMTIHSAKGLEFNDVYLAGVEEELFPSRMSFNSPQSMEEERRLFYVAVTRAKKRVTITYTQSRYRWGTPTDCKPSRFIDEIDPDFTDRTDDTSQKASPWQNDSLAGFPDRSPASQINKNIFVPPSNGKGRLKRIDQTERVPMNTSKSADPDFKSDAPELIQTGMNVEHQRFGMGKVIQLEGDFPNRKALVHFQEINQQKQLLLKFAKLRIVKTI